VVQSVMRKTGGQGTHVGRCLATASSPLSTHRSYHTTDESEAADCAFIVPTDKKTHVKATDEHAVSDSEGRGDVTLRS